MLSARQVAGIDQTQHAGTSSGGTWVKLGEWQFNQAGTGQQVTLNPRRGA